MPWCWLKSVTLVRAYANCVWLMATFASAKTKDAMANRGCFNNCRRKEEHALLCPASLGHLRAC